MADIGLTNLHVAKMTTEDTATTAPVYATPKRIVGVNSVSVSPENETVTLYGDNKALATKTKTKKNKVSLKVAKLMPEDKALILGNSYDSITNVVSTCGDDAAPYVALLYEINKDDGTKELVAWYKGKFAPSEEDNNTEGESMAFGLYGLEGEFVSRIDNNKVKDTRLIDATDTATSAAFFASVGGGLS